MRVAFVMGGIPSLGYSGSTIAAWTILTELLAAGHEASAVLLPEPALRDEDTAPRLAALERAGLDVHVVDVAKGALAGGRWRRRFDFARSLAYPRDEELFPATRARPAVASVIRTSGADGVIAFAMEAIAAVDPATAPPALALLSHPPGVSRRVRLRYLPAGGAVGRLSQRSYLAYADRRAARLLRAFPSVGVFSRRHADWARARGAPAWYAHFPMPDPGPVPPARPGERPRILMIGHLRGIGTISGLEPFAYDILPALDRRLGPDGFHVHVVGGHDPPPAFAEALRHPAIRLRGQVADPGVEFLAADVLLAPNPTVTGASARIVSGLSYGACIVAHTDSLVGIPELAHGENCLLGANGPALADETLRALADPELRERVGTSARALYERAFSPPVAARRIVREIESLAGQPPFRAASSDR